MRVGLRYARHEPGLLMVIAKTVPFALCSTALVALLPAVARFRLDAGPTAFGGLSAAMGLGAVAVLFLLPRLRKHLGPDAIVALAMIVYGGVLFGLAATTTMWVAFIVLAFAGAATLAFTSTVLTSVQLLLPAWVRGRGLAVFLLALQASFAAGALTWGAIAEGAGLDRALFIAGVAMLAGALLTLPVRLRRLGEIDASSVELSWPQPTPVTSLHDDDGPILVSVEWQIDAEDRDDFVRAMQPIRRAVQRDGALGWHLYDDIETDGLLLETFTLPTWAEFQRMRHRTTQEDRKLEESLLPFLTDERLPEARHFRSTRRGPHHR
jgi:MFS family permease